MPTSASLEELEQVEKELETLENKYPEAYQELAHLFDSNRGIGYKNLARLLMGEQTPAELKGVDD